MFSADSALAILHTCAPGELEEALRNRPEMIIRLRNVLDAFPPGPGIGTASQSSTTPQPAAATQASASTTAPQPFAQPCMVQASVVRQFSSWHQAHLRDLRRKHLQHSKPLQRHGQQALSGGVMCRIALLSLNLAPALRGAQEHGTWTAQVTLGKERHSTTPAKIGGTGTTGDSPGGGTKITDALHPHRHRARLPDRQDSAARHQSSMSRTAMLGRKDGQSAPFWRRTCATRHMAAHGTGASAARCCAP